MKDKKKKSEYDKKRYEMNKSIILEKNKTYYEKNKEAINNNRKPYSKNYYSLNKEKIIEQHKGWVVENKEKRKEYLKNYRENNKTRRNQNNRNRMKNDPAFKFISYVRSLINNSLRRMDYPKNKKTEEILGCSFNDFKSHLETQFAPWMNWDNRGNPKDGIFELNKTWDVDHIIPLSTALTENEIIKLSHYSNLKPVCSYYNRWIKKNKIIL
jgi:hypothetical protein